MARDSGPLSSDSCKLQGGCLLSGGFGWWRKNRVNGIWSIEKGRLFYCCNWKEAACFLIFIPIKQSNCFDFCLTHIQYKYKLTEINDVPSNGYHQINKYNIVVILGSSVSYPILTHIFEKLLSSTLKLRNNIHNAHDTIAGF